VGVGLGPEGPEFFLKLCSLRWWLFMHAFQNYVFRGGVKREEEMELENVSSSFRCLSLQQVGEVRNWRHSIKISILTEEGRPNQRAKNMPQFISHSSAP